VVRETDAYGFRNPYRFAFDRTDLGGHGDLILADVVRARSRKSTA